MCPGQRTLSLIGYKLRYNNNNNKYLFPPSHPTPPLQNKEKGRQTNTCSIFPLHNTPCTRQSSWQLNPHRVVALFTSGIILGCPTKTLFYLQQSLVKTELVNFQCCTVDGT